MHIWELPTGSDRSRNIRRRLCVEADDPVPSRRVREGVEYPLQCRSRLAELGRGRLCCGGRARRWEAPLPCHHSHSARARGSAAHPRPSPVPRSITGCELAADYGPTHLRAGLALRIINELAFPVVPYFCSATRVASRRGKQRHLFNGASVGWSGLGHYYL